MSRAFAAALTDRFSFAEANGLLREVAIRDPALVKWVQDAAAASEHIRTDSSFLPD